MEYINRKEFIPKIKLNKYSLGSFDTFSEDSQELIKEILNITVFTIGESTTEFLKLLPTAYRASIVRNDDNEYIGYISAYNIDFKSNLASIILQTKLKLAKNEINDIITSYKEFLYNDLYIYNIKDLYIFNKNEEIVEYNYFNIKNSHINSNYFNIRNIR